MNIIEIRVNVFEGQCIRVATVSGTISSIGNKYDKAYTVVVEISYRSQRKLECDTE